ncbi:hypothetical protein OPV22_032913 [Ensete ventricosum]|uniref:Protein WEAK CHLOROPLAST MOVEMENT UNDER BLUE LIGHT 1-like n=1 Tax=Ensete ventricosum TaxID=4639 RepID=A0AAV8PXX3_ENSVE|nr:hypothetical protein OPV22_032913 [Ensete ventricosum]
MAQRQRESWNRESSEGSADLKDEFSSPSLPSCAIKQPHFAPRSPDGGVKIGNKTFLGIGQKNSDCPQIEEAMDTEKNSYPVNSFSSPDGSCAPDSKEDNDNRQHGALDKNDKIPFLTNDLNTSTLDQRGYVVSENKPVIKLEDIKVNLPSVHRILAPYSSNESKELGTPQNGVSENLKKYDASRVLVDTTAPFESVKEAATKFGGVANWKAQKTLITERRKHVQFELKKAQEEIPKYKEQYEAVEAVKGQVLKELDYTKRLVEELKLSLEKAETQEAQAKQDSELADLRLKEMEKGITNNASVVAKTQLEVAKERHASAVAELISVKQELESIQRRYVSLVHEKDIAIRTAKESVSASKKLEKTVEDLTLELITTKELLESAHSAHLEAEEQRIGAALALEQDKLNWEKELKQAESELQQLNEQLLVTNDLESKLDRASSLLVGLKVELALYMESKLNLEVNSTQELNPIVQTGDINETETNVQTALATTTKELEEVRFNIENANDEVNCLRVAVSALKSELEREKASLTTMRQREGLASASVSSLEAELTRINTELELILIREKEAREKLVELPKALQQAAEEADQAKLVANLAREDLRKAKEEAQHAKAGASTLETRLSAALKEIEAAKASEKLAISAVKALEESEQASMKCEDSSNGVTLPIEEYYTLSKKANEAEEIANKKVISAIEQMKAAKESESRSLIQLEEANKRIKEKKKAQRAAVDKAKKAMEGKLGVEQELRTWRADHVQQRKVGGIRRSFSDSSNLVALGDTVSIASEADSQTRSLRVHMARSNTTNTTPDSERRPRSFFPRIVMFLARKKVQSLK